MQNPSRPVRSSQPLVHPGLARRVLRHASTPWQKPPQDVDAPALERLANALALHRGPVVLDSFCGTGMSTALLAQEAPDALVIGVDKSAHRLERKPDLPPNGLLLQANCEAIWRYLAQKGVRLDAHYCLYPNPWPKPAQLSRRIHGHPAFGELLALGGIIELRSNWQVYVEEFGVALHLYGIAASISRVPEGSRVTTRFEIKYRESGHRLWRLQARIKETQ